MIKMSSMPYIFLRPTMSARIPKPICPITVPVEVATLMAVSALEGIFPGEWVVFLNGELGLVLRSVGCAYCQNTTPNMDTTMLTAKRSYASTRGINSHIDHPFVSHTCEEADTGDDNGTNMVPAKRSLVNLSKSKSSPLIRVCYVGVVVMKVMKRRVPTGRPVKVVSPKA